jgi:hypothetical protein
MIANGGSHSIVARRRTGAAVDQRREHSAAHAKGLADGRHAEYNVQVLAHELHKMSVYRVTALRLPGLLGERTDSREDLLHFFGLHQVGHLTRVEQVVHILNHGLSAGVDKDREGSLNKWELQSTWSAEMNAAKWLSLSFDNGL